MKNLLFTQTKIIFALFSWLLLPNMVHSQINVTMSLTNPSITSNEIQFDMNIINDGPGTCTLYGMQFGVNFNTALLNLGTPGTTDFSYIAGSMSPSPILSQFTYSTQYSNNQMRFVAFANTGAQAFPVGASYKLGRFKFTNTTTWAACINPTLSLQLTTQAGKTRCEVAVIPTGSGTISIVPGLVGSSFLGVVNPIYTNSQASNDTREEIYKVTLNGGSTPSFYANTPPGCTNAAPGNGSILGRYSNFNHPSITCLTTLVPGSTVPILIEENECDGAPYNAFGTGVWIDWTHDGDFDDAGEQVLLESATLVGPRNITGSITVPITATCGPTIMRVVVAEGFSGAALTPCLQYTYGETEDHLVNVVNPGNVTTVSASGSYTWAANGVTYTASGTYYDNSNCDCSSHGLILTIVPSNTLNCLVNQHISCNGANDGSITATAGPTGVYTYILTKPSPPGATVTITNTTATFTGLGPGTYTVCVNGVCCITTITQPDPLLITLANTACGEITATITGGTPILSFGYETEWWNSSGPLPGGPFDVVRTGLSAGSYTVYAIDANGCQAVATITINTTLPLANAGPDVTITCTTPSAPIGTTAIAGNTYTWTPSAGLSATNIATPIATPTVNTCYTVTVTNSSNGCIATDVVCVFVNKTLPIANAGPDVTITCTTPSATIGTTAIAGNTYTWTPSAGLSATNIATPIATPTVTTCYTVTVTNSSNGCTATDVVCVFVNKTLPIANAGPDVTITCTTPSAPIGTTAIAGNTYTWTPSAGLSATNIATPIATPTVNTCYTVTVTNSSNGCTATDVVCVFVNKTLPIANAGPDVTITCTTPSAPIGTTAIAGNTYTWTPSAGLSATNIATPIATPTVNTCYTVTVTNSSNGCTATDVVCVFVNKTLPIANAGPDVTITCTTPSAPIGTTAIAGNTYTWTPSAGLSATNIATPIATPTVNTCYTVTVTNSSNGCTATDVVCVFVNKTLPIANAGPDVTITCTAPSAPIGTTAIAGNTYTWTPSAGLSATNIATPIATPTVNTCYTVTVTNSSNGCTATDVVCVFVNKTLPIANAGPDVTITCTTPSAPIGTTAIAGNTYTWTPSAGLSATNIATPIATPTVNTCYTVTVTNSSNGCTATDVVCVFVNKTLPIANAGPDVTITCTTPSAPIGTTVIAGNTYTWTPSAGLSATNIATPIATPTVNTCYTVTVTNSSNGCTATDVVCVFVNKTLPIANAGPDVTITCTAPSAPIGTTAIAGNTYTWTPSAGLSATNIATPIATPTVNTCYTVTVTNSSNGCTATDVVCVFVNKTLPIANAGPDVTITCTTPSAPIGTTAIAGNTYTWTPSAGLSATNIATPIATPTVNTCYTVTVTNSSNGCTATDVVCVFVNKTLPIANAGPDVTITCTTPSAPIGTTVIAGNTYTWTPSAGLSATNIATPIATPTVNTCYTVTVTNSSNGCTATDVVCVFVNKTLPIANAGPDVTITCTAPSAPIGTTAIAGNTYTWTPSAGLSATNIATPIATPTVNTCYTVTVTNSSNGCTATDVVCVFVNKTLPIANAGPDVTITCTTPSAPIGTTAIAGNTYTWTPSAGLSATNIATPIATPTVNTCYTVTVTNSSNGCTATDVVCVFVNKTLPIANAGPDVTITCTTPSAPIGTTAIAGNTYTWTPSAGLSATNIATPIATPTVNTCYTVTVTNSSNGCTATDVVCVFVNKTLPIANAGLDVFINCINPIAFVGTPFIAGNTYTWTPTAGLSATNVAAPIATPLVTTCYTVTVTNSSNGCTATDVVCVFVNKTPPLANAGIDKTITCCTPPSVTIGTVGFGGYTYTWSPSAGLSATNIATPIATPTATTCYTVTVTNISNGCTATDVVCVTINKTAVANAGPDVTINCYTPTTVIGTIGLPGYTYVWSPPLGLTSTTSAQPNATPSSTTCYTVTATNATNCCTATDVVCVTVNKAKPVVTASNIIRCVGDIIDFTTYVSPLISPLVGVFNPTSPFTGVLMNSTYTYTVTNPINGCSTQVIRKLIINPKPTITASANDYEICEDELVLIWPSGGSGTYTISPVGVNQTTTTTFSVTPTATTTYTITGKNSSNCTNTTTVTITVFPKPTITVTASKDPICAGESVTLTPGGGTTYTITPNGETSASATASFAKTPTATTTYTITGANANGCTATATITVTVNQCTGVYISPKVYLSGPFDPTATGPAKMKDDLRACNKIPLTEPYSSSTLTFGTTLYFATVLEDPNETINPSVLLQTGDNAIVDWVFLELRSAITADNYLVKATRRALLQRDGDVVDIDGVSPVFFEYTPIDNYYVSIKHRNHLGVMTAAAIPLSGTSSSPTLADFTSSLVNGSVGIWTHPSLTPIAPSTSTTIGYNQQRREQPIQSGVFTLWAGDANTNLNVKFNSSTTPPDDDKTAILAYPLSGSQYALEDVNMDCNVIKYGGNNDKNVVQGNITNCPQNIPVSNNYVLYQHLPY